MRGAKSEALWPAVVVGLIGEMWFNPTTEIEISGFGVQVSGLRVKGFRGLGLEFVWVFGVCVVRCLDFQLLTFGKIKL